MLKTFNNYINEESSNDSDSFQYASDIINHIQKVNNTGDSYIEIRGPEYNGIDKFDLVIQLKKTDSPNFETDSHFKDLPWEEINFNKYGYALDANTFIDKEDLIIPKIVITLIINQKKEPNLYKELNYKLIDILAHEVNHTKQVGWNRKPFKVRPSSNSDREKSKHAASYFLLPDEIESMVTGMYERSKVEDTNIDDIMDKYLYPFLMDGQINGDEYKKTLETWIKYALENYPDCKLSMDDEKVRKIVQSI